MSKLDLKRVTVEYPDYTDPAGVVTVTVPADDVNLISLALNAATALTPERTSLADLAHDWDEAFFAINHRNVVRMAFVSGHAGLAYANPFDPSDAQQCHVEYRDAYLTGCATRGA